MTRVQERPGPLLRRWLALWRVHEVDLASPLPAAVAEERLRAVLTRRSWWRRPQVPRDRRIVEGQVRDGEVRVVATMPTFGNSFTHELRGRLTDTAEGSRLTGTLGWRRLVRVLTAVSLVVWPAVVVAGAVLAVRELLLGAGATGYAVPLLVGGVAGTHVVLMTWFLGSAGAADGEFLMSSVREALAVR
ncbi:hypothetical protein [Blastococcus sp. TF02A-35]|uniref:hypothetical protein n=1 Tax=Blastococcus sp. TF02A-35 TaxID=2559612 RepID=UPI001074916A|nr:hypothetical protein [Blastococcus sp. TF02A_35]TFV52685.1 hypothetical protein E4P43_05135 [Blastococcus sp. TF02A_35]